MDSQVSNTLLDSKINHLIDNFGLKRVLSSVNNYLEKKADLALQANSNEIGRWQNATGLCRMLEAEVEFLNNLN